MVSIESICGECKRTHVGFETETERHGEPLAKLSDTPIGARHLHFLYVKGRWEWVVRHPGGSPLCKTVRCRRVEIAKPTPADELDALMATA